jgi:DNA-binding transcriptional MerR regulator
MTKKSRKLRAPTRRSQQGEVVETVARHIYVIRGQKIMLDRDLAELYGVKAIALRQQVARNPMRFPKDFKFQLTDAEADFLVSQNVIPSRRSMGGYLPYGYTQEGVAMLSSVIRSYRAVQVNIAIMRAFVRLREQLSTHKYLARRIDELEQKYSKHDCNIAELKQIFDAMKGLTHIPASQPRHGRIGFVPTSS